MLIAQDGFSVGSFNSTNKVYTNVVDQIDTYNDEHSLKMTL